MTKQKKTIIITVAAILAIALFLGLTFLLKNSNSTPNNNTFNNSSTAVTSSIVNDATQNNSNENNSVINKPDSSVTVENIETSRGKEILVPVVLKNNPGIMASAFEINYNTDVLEYNGYTEGDVFENYKFIEKENSIFFTNIENGDVKKDGVIFNLKFKVKENASLGDTKIDINITNQSFVNYNEEFVNLNGGNAIVTIK